MPKSPARYPLVPVLYGGVVLLLLLIAAFTREFSLGVGDARVAGRYAPFPLFQSRALQNITLSWNGMTMRFTRASSPGLQSVETTDSGTDIIFADGSRVRLTPGNDAGGSLLISPIGSAADSAGAALVVPLAVSGVLTEPPVNASLAWKRAGRTYLLSLAAGARLDASSRSLALPLDGTTWTARLQVVGGAVAAAPLRSAMVRAAVPAARLPQESSMPSADKLLASLSGFADKAYAGWSRARISADAQWKTPDGSVGFSEDIGVGLVSESIARGTWQTVLPVWTDALARQQRRAPDAPPVLTTSTYVGSTRNYVETLRARTAQEIQRLRPLLADSSTAVLAEPGLVPLLADHGTPDLLQAAAAFLIKTSTASLDVPEALALAEGLVDYAQDVESSDAILRAIKDAVDRKLLPAVLTADGGVFLDSGRGRVDVSTSIRCGSLLLRAGALLDSGGAPLDSGGAPIASARASAIGRGLIASSLGLADGLGVMPAELTLASGRIAARQGSLTPESVYAFLPLDLLDRRVPREVPLLRQLGPGTWIWTSAKVTVAEGSASEARFILAYPVGIPHYFAIQGIKPFTQIRMHGISWRTDPTYARYSDGWAYDAAAGTFYGKLTGRVEAEEIDFTF